MEAASILNGDIMKRIILKLAIVTALIACNGCVSFFRVDGPYEGKVVDAETKQPLKGVVVLGVWNIVHSNVSGANYSFYDSIELLTDKNGEFSIHGQGLRILSNLDEMDIVIFKAGYEMIGYGPWSGLKTATMKDKVKWDNGKAIVLIKKLSYEERKNSIWSRPLLELVRQRLLTNEINKERIEFGYKPL